MKNPAPLHNTLLAFAFLFLATTGFAQREAPKAAEIKQTTSTSAAVFNAKGTPAKITDSYGIYTDFNLRTKADADKLKAQIGSTLFEEIANNCNETNGWPGAISSYNERNKVRDQMEKYVCYQIAEVDDKWILRVPASENSFLPYGVRPDHDIFFAIGKSYVTLTGSPSNTATGGSSYSSSTTTPTSSYTSVSNLKGPRAKIKDSFGIWTDFVLTTKADASQVKDKLGYTLYSDVADNCSETKWPSGISSYAMREKVRKEMLDYVCYQIGESDDKWILRVPVAENSFQPYNMRPTHDIYFMVRKSDVDLSGSPINTLSESTVTTPVAATTTNSSSFPSYLNGSRAKINATGGMYSTFDLKSDAKASYFKGYFGYSLFDEIAMYIKEDKWPSGIATLSARDLVRTKMTEYKAYKIGETDGKYILRIPADENKFMPYNMQPTHDIYFAINQTDVSLNGTSTYSSTPSAPAAPAKTSTATSGAIPSDNYGKKATISSITTLLPDYDFEGNDATTELKQQLSTTEYEAVLKYNKAKYWPSGIATEANRTANSSKFENYKATVVADFMDNSYEFYVVLKLTPKDNASMPSSLRPANTIYIVVVEDDVEIE